MTSKLKRDQLAPKKAENWRASLKEEEEYTLKLIMSDIILQKETYKILAGENENRLRIYLGLEPQRNEGRYELCAFAVSAFLLGSGDVYADYETPVYKLGKKNVKLSDNTNGVIESIRLYRKWRAGELDEQDAGAAFRQYIYPNAYLLTKFELHELFNSQNKDEIKIEFGISKTMTAMLSPVDKSSADSGNNTDDEVEEGSDAFGYADICPPVCDERSVFNPS